MQRIQREFLISFKISTEIRIGPSPFGSEKLITFANTQIGEVDSENNHVGS
jgi:hypothetical protein